MDERKYMGSFEGWIFVLGMLALFGWGIRIGVRGLAAPLGKTVAEIDPYRITLCPSHAGRIITEEEGRDLWRTA
jgi:hypothetical protein